MFIIFSYLILFLVTAEPGYFIQFDVTFMQCIHTIDHLHIYSVHEKIVQNYKKTISSSTRENNIMLVAH